MLTLFNTLSRQKEKFQPLKKNEVGLYTCGPTVYNYAHLGNLRTYLFEDILKRTLLANKYKVNHVMNITDVGHLTSDADEGEEKLENSRKDALYLKCEKCGKDFFSGIVATGTPPTLINNKHLCPFCDTWNTAKDNSAYFKNSKLKNVWEIAEFYTRAFKKDMLDLNLLKPTQWAKATDHIQEQIDWVKKLEKKRFTYKTSDGIYFNTSKFENYGQLRGQQSSELQEGARVEKNKEKKNPSDFALWKFSPKNSKRQMEWDSPWGIGFPGWHLECSVMAQKYLGETIDIHCGGIDHISTHHTNEIAQAEVVTNKPFAKYWLHGEFLVLEKDTRMGKSVGNFITLNTVKEKQINPLAYRYFTLGTHYRKPLSFSWEALLAAQNALDNLYALVANLGEPKIGCAEFEQKFSDAINDDLNTPQALAVVWDLLKSEYPNEAKKASLLKFDEVLGLDMAKAKPIDVPSEIKKLSQEREQFRQEKQFEAADECRAKIVGAGYKVEDTPAGPVIKKSK